MRSFLTVPAAAVLVLAAAVPDRQQQGGDEPLTVSAVRFYSPASATTTIEGVCEVRVGAFVQGAAPTVRFRMEIAVLDSAGLELQRSDWTRDLPATAARVRGATVVESFGFRAAPGRYRVQVRVTPEGGPPLQRELVVEAFPRAPALSDLLVATAARRVPDTAAMVPGEVRRGNLVLLTAPVPHLTATEATLSYYAEVYPRIQAVSGELRAEVLAADGRALVRTPPRTISIGAQGAVTQGSVDLTGLPEGHYRFRMTLALPDTTLRTEAAFGMAPLSAVATAPETAPERDLFEGLEEVRLDSLFAPLVYLAERQSDLSVYRRLTVEGKRRFLREFWQQRDPTPGTPDNAARDEFYRGVAYTTSAFREGGTGEIPGWNTDRGRVYLKNGRPDEVLRRPAASPRPYEVWKYTRTRQRFYVYYDETGLGNVRLIGTNDQRETNRVGWERTVGIDAARDIYNFLGRDVRDVEQILR
jgi:GWxTD domain-containing protein